jgi:hypothetical protein
MASYSLNMESAQEFPNVATRIIDGVFGGTRKLARGLRLSASTVQSWKVAGYIPPKRQPKVLALARRRGLKLEPADFFPELPKSRAA